EGARPHGPERHQPRAATQRRARGELRPEGEQTGTSGHPAEEEVDRDRLAPRRRLDDGASVVGVELARTLDLDVLDDRTLARAVAHPDLGETATPTAPPRRRRPGEGGGRSASNSLMLIGARPGTTGRPPPPSRQRRCPPSRSWRAATRWAPAGPAAVRRPRARPAAGTPNRSLPRRPSGSHRTGGPRSSRARGGPRRADAPRP